MKRHLFSQVPRHGVTLVETAIVLSLAMTVIVGLLELVVFMNRYQSCSHAVRRLAREAALRGSRSGPEKTVWGPTEITTTASSSHDIAQIVRPWLMMVRPEDVTIRIHYPDGDNHRGDRVQIDLSYPFTRTSRLFGVSPSMVKTITSTMEIAH